MVEPVSVGSQGAYPATHGAQSIARSANDHTLAGSRDTNSATPQSVETLSPQAVDALKEVNAAMEAWNTGMKFEIDEDTQKVVVSIVDKGTGEVLRQVPSKELLHISKMIAQFQGNFVNTEA